MAHSFKENLAGVTFLEMEFSADTTHSLFIPQNLIPDVIIILSMTKVSRRYFGIRASLDYGGCLRVKRVGPHGKREKVRIVPFEVIHVS